MNITYGAWEQHKNKHIEDMQYCSCDCHTGGGIHIEACCGGKCEGCQRNINIGFMNEHRLKCEQWWEWAKKQKRAELKRLQLYDTFLRIKNGVEN